VRGGDRAAHRIALMAATAPRALQFKLDQVRAWAIGVIAVTLIASGMLVVLRSMSVEEQVREYYEQALALTQVALETKESGADLRIQQTRLARSLTNGALLAPAPDAAALGATVRGLATGLDEIDKLGLSNEEQTRLTQVRAALADIRTVNSELIDTRARGEVGIETARDLAARSQQRFEVFDNTLSELVGAVRLRTVNAARSAEELNATARYWLMALFAVTLVLGVLSIMLVLRTLKANRALLSGMQQLAREDALTGAINRRGLDDVVPIEFARARTAAAIQRATQCCEARHKHGSSNCGRPICWRATAERNSRCCCPAPTPSRRSTWSTACAHRCPIGKPFRPASQPGMATKPRPRFCSEPTLRCCKRRKRAAIEQ
jgi:GGDEF domain-containing protein